MYCTIKRGIAVSKDVRSCRSGVFTVKAGMTTRRSSRSYISAVALPTVAETLPANVAVPSPSNRTATLVPLPDVFKIGSSQCYIESYREKLTNMIAWFNRMPLLLTLSLTLVQTWQRRLIEYLL